MGAVITKWVFVTQMQPEYKDKYSAEESEVACIMGVSPANIAGMVTAISVMSKLSREESIKFLLKLASEKLLAQKIEPHC